MNNDEGHRAEIQRGISKALLKKKWDAKQVAAYLLAQENHGILARGKPSWMLNSFESELEHGWSPDQERLVHLELNVCRLMVDLVINRCHPEPEDERTV